MDFKKNKHTIHDFMPLSPLNSSGKNARFYTVFGVGISSEIVLPELVQSENDPVVFIRMSSDDFANPAKQHLQCHGEYNSEEAVVSFKNVGSFRIRGGTDIDIWQDSCADNRLIRMFLHGIVSAILLHQRGLLVLHGSCMAIQDRAVGFLGPSGAGKSSMAAGLHQRGHDVLSEDIVAIDYSNGKPVTYPGIPQLKLTADIITGLGYPELFIESLYPLSNEFIYRYNRKLSSECIDLSCIFVITDADRINIRHLSPQEGFKVLMKNSYTANIIEPTKSQISHFQCCTQLLNKIPICLLERPMDFKLLPDVSRKVEEFVLGL